ncbi:hypothetical protein KIN20_023934 [Parelaphostrongylus tenuis]|uniref:Uncharacterized protein n=1 Tax=Parelaphostrongylus tenuis TaxID=148309 RepID=A0AAD5NAJ0_PARTN|nr:hypothetical protein KIN20_023934 [Parelaphostrongylus tenuis]
MVADIQKYMVTKNCPCIKLQDFDCEKHEPACGECNQLGIPLLTIIPQVWELRYARWADKWPPPQSYFYVHRLLPTSRKDFLTNPQDNTKPHAAKKAKEKFHDVEGAEVLPHSVTPDAAPSDCGSPPLIETFPTWTQIRDI